MHPNTSDNKFSEQLLRQVAADARRALLRARYCIERSRIERFMCVDEQEETDTQFGRQLWFFEGSGVDELDRRSQIYGALEYSLQYGLHEMVEDGVFEVAEQRHRFLNVYRSGSQRASWKHPAHRWLLAGVLAVTIAFSLFLLVRWLGNGSFF